MQTQKGWFIKQTFDNDFVNKLEGCLKRKVDGVIINLQKPQPSILKKYAAQKAELVTIDKKDPFWHQHVVYLSKLIDTRSQIVRHDAGKLAALIQKIISEN